MIWILPHNYAPHIVLYKHLTQVRYEKNIRLLCTRAWKSQIQLHYSSTPGVNLIKPVGVYCMYKKKLQICRLKAQFIGLFTGLDIFSCSSRIKTRHSYFPALSLHSVSCTTSTNPLLSAICKSASDPIKREHRRYYFIFNARLCTNFKTFRKMYPNFKWLLITSYYPGFPHANTDIWPCMCFTPLTL